MSWILNTVIFIASYIVMKKCSLPNIITVIKSRQIRWVGHVARMGRRVCMVLVWKPEGKRQLGDIGIDERIVLKYVSGNFGECGLD
jgi:hypothetical protein